LHGRDRLAIVAEQVDELRRRSEWLFARQDRPRREGDRGRGVEGLGFDRSCHDMHLQVGAETHYDRTTRAAEAPKTCPQGSHESTNDTADARIRIEPSKM